MDASGKKSGGIFDSSDGFLRRKISGRRTAEIHSDVDGVCVLLLKKNGFSRLIPNEAVKIEAPVLDVSQLASMSADAEEASSD